MKPSEIVRRLNQHVVGQEEAKKILAVAVYGHGKKTAQLLPDAVGVVKSNIPLIGPTGTGKTLFCETLSHILDLPFVTADATTLAQTEYVGDEIDAILQRLVDKAGGDIGRRSAASSSSTKSTVQGGRRPAARPSGERVQHALLKIMEGRRSVAFRPAHRHHACAFIWWRRLRRARDDIMGRNHSFDLISTRKPTTRRFDRINARVSRPTSMNSG